MQFTHATSPAPGRRNEDQVITGPTWAAVLDGATQRPDVETGCSHGVAWLVRTLSGALAGRLAQELGTPLPDLLADAIRTTRAAHARCDLANPDSPSSTVAILRLNGPALDWLVLADSPILIATADQLHVHCDDRTARLPGYTTEAVRALRNSPDGFWVAGTDPDAAHESLTGSVPAADVRRAALLSDGASRLVDRFDLMTWPALLDLLSDHGPTELIRRTRAAEAALDPASHRGKQFDDATAVLVTFD